jgi:uncharacterized protein YndB with AHSA1/START domain
MSNAKTIEIKIERTIPASPGDVFDGWLNPKTPGTPWNMAGKLILKPVVDEVFYLSLGGTAHYGRFSHVERSERIEHTWVSPNTSGLESTVTVTFQKKGKHTLMTLVHSGLPDTDGGRSHNKGWNYFLDGFLSQLTKSAAT